MATNLMKFTNAALTDDERIVLSSPDGEIAFLSYDLGLEIARAVDCDLQSIGEEIRENSWKALADR